MAARMMSPHPSPTRGPLAATDLDRGGRPPYESLGSVAIGENGRHIGVAVEFGVTGSGSRSRGPTDLRSDRSALDTQAR